MTLNAILCEGAAEQAILEILLENDVLTIKKESLFEEKKYFLILNIQYYLYLSV